MVFSKEISLHTKGDTDIIDITDRVRSITRESDIDDGQVAVSAVGSTAGITTIEYETGLVSDFKQAMERIAPKNISYEHNKAWQDGNGHSHIRASIIGCSKVFPLINGKLSLGTWQQIVYIDFDNRPRSRKIVVQVTG